MPKKLKKLKCSNYGDGRGTDTSLLGKGSYYCNSSAQFEMMNEKVDLS